MPEMESWETDIKWTSDECERVVLEEAGNAGWEAAVGGGSERGLDASRLRMGQASEWEWRMRSCFGSRQGVAGYA